MWQAHKPYNTTVSISNAHTPSPHKSPKPPSLLMQTRHISNINTLVFISMKVAVHNKRGTQPLYLCIQQQYTPPSLTQTQPAVSTQTRPPLANNNRAVSKTQPAAQAPPQPTSRNYHHYYNDSQLPASHVVPLLNSARSECGAVHSGVPLEDLTTTPRLYR